ncbi:YggS family pyridoxal phosphate-dependent enzyme [Bifidobacterium sp. ESL0769]|uniref:YggS family pyridoxal phosphate-dependent enzyme n=1 Tax=Bifidobacterium sp. ESL0769 TaxID=2983229 RepID=UPI0023F8A604|nr:YggS family pyridoxal phosphate-dependent enzyme [Bifidobacterium sp. ESL0769]WEV68357.1 YggS family pyridoxal phosphate-dependent enzyme [Bifidobacterium sp. ESL0769]
MTAYMDHKDLANEVIDEARIKEITDGVHRVLDDIAKAEVSSGRETGSVRLLAATKTRDVGEIMAAIDAGVRMIGENRPQEISAKAEGLIRQCAQRGFSLGAAVNGQSANGSASANVLNGNGSNDASASAQNDNGSNDSATTNVRNASASAASQTASNGHIPFHLIGQLQSNKIGKVLPYVDTIESVGSLEEAQKIARRAVARHIVVGVLMEVNESGEASKSGCEPDEAVDLAYQIASLEGLQLQGLMTIGAHVDDEKTIRNGFAHLRGTRDTILKSGEPGTAQCRELSMGMTHDMDYAVAEGSTIVRVGTAIFGERAFI